MGSVGLSPGGEQVLAVLCSSTIVAMFTVSSVAKASDVAVFVRTLRVLVSGLGARRASVTALYVIGIEGATALWLASALAHKAAALAAVCVLGAFAAVAFLARRAGVRCNCFGTHTDATLGWSTVARNLALSTLALPALAGAELPGDRFPVFAIQILAAIACAVALDLHRMAPRFLQPPAPPGAPGIQWLDKESL